MQDICRAAELSPGAVYLYFRSKEEIIEAMVEERRRHNAALIGDAFAKEETLEVFDELAQAFFSMIDAPGADTGCRLDIELWGEALRNASINESIRKNFTAVRTPLASIIERAQQRGEIEKSLDPVAVARIMMAFYQGLLLQKAVDPDADVWSYVAAVKSMMGGTFWVAGRDNAEDLAKDRS